MLNAKCKGTVREHRSIALLEASGYRCTRAAASLGAWDIIATNGKDCRSCVKSKKKERT